MSVSARFQAVRDAALFCAPKAHAPKPRFYDLQTPADCDALCRGLFAHLLPPLLDCVATLHTADQVHRWLASALLYARDTDVYDALAHAYDTAADLGPRMCAPGPSPGPLSTTAPWNRAIRCLHMAFVSEFWTRNAAVLRAIAAPPPHGTRARARGNAAGDGGDGDGDRDRVMLQQLMDKVVDAELVDMGPAPHAAASELAEAVLEREGARHPPPPGAGGAGEGVGGGAEGAGGKCHVHLTADTWASVLQRRCVLATVLVEWDMQEAENSEGDSVTPTADALRCCTLGARDDGDGLRAPSGALDRCAVAGLQPDALVTREVCCTWISSAPGPSASDHLDADNFFPFGSSVPFDAARFQPPTYDAARGPRAWAAAVRRAVRKFFTAAMRRGARVLVLPLFACRPPCNGPVPVLASVYAEAIEETLGCVEEVLVCTGDAAFVPVVSAELHAVLGRDNPAILWTGDESRHRRRCKCEDISSSSSFPPPSCSLPWCTDLHLYPRDLPMPFPEL